jgi:hypothetical protein
MLKHLHLLTGTIIFIILTSCVSHYNQYYQVYELESDNVRLNNDQFSFENSDLIITYNFWSLYGGSSISIFNKTNEDVIIDLAKSHFIINNFAETYYQNRTFTNSSSTTTGSAVTTEKTMSSAKSNNLLRYISRSVQSSENYQSGSAVATTEIKEMIIPKSSFKIINGFEIKSELFRHCDLLLYPRKNNYLGSKEEGNTMNPPQNSVYNFNKSDSIVMVRNIISYTMGSNVNKIQTVENSFWVKSVRNMSSGEFVSDIYEEFCGKRYNKTVYNFFAPNKFYINYPYGEYGTRN